MNFISKLGRYVPTVVIGALAAFVFGGQRAKADVEVTYTVNVTSTPPMQPRPGMTMPKMPETVKAYYSGDKARIEQVDGPVTIYDIAGKQVYHVNPDTKTYYVQPLGGGNRGGGGFGGRGAGATATLTKTSDTKTILSGTGVRYALDGSMSFGNFGGFGGDAPTPPAGSTPPGMSLSGDIWFSDSVPLPADSTSAEPEVSVISFGQRMFTQPLSVDVLSIKQIPLSGKITMAMNFPSFGGGDPISRTVIETFSTTDIAKVPVSSALFTPPSGYTQVDPPARRGFGGFGGGGRPGGGFGGGGGGGGFGGGGNGGGGGGFGNGGPPPADNGGDNGGGPPPDNGGGPPPDNGGGDNGGDGGGN